MRIYVTAVVLLLFTLPIEAQNDSTINKTKAIHIIGQSNWFNRGYYFGCGTGYRFGKHSVYGGLLAGFRYDMSRRSKGIFLGYRYRTPIEYKRLSTFGMLYYQHEDFNFNRFYDLTLQAGFGAAYNLFGNFYVEPSVSGGVIASYANGGVHPLDNGLKYPKLCFQAGVGLRYEFTLEDRVKTN